MKKIISFLAFAILASSCGNYLSITKRHYTKGYYVETGKKSEHLTLAKTEVKNKKADKVEKMAPTVLSLMNGEKTTEQVFTASLKTNKSQKKAAEHTYIAQLQSHVELQKGVLINTVRPVLKSNLVLKEAKTESRKGSGDTNVVLLVILSLFPLLALLAMYLHDGNKVTANFWVDLLLHLTVIGYAIFALLVVFDVVNLA